MVPWRTQTKTKMTINMIKKMTQYLLQRRCALSLLLMLMLLQPVMAADTGS